MPKKQNTELVYKESKFVPTTIISKPVRLQLPPAHPRQWEFVTALDRNPQYRFIVAACGTKFGKTFGSTIAITKYAWNNKGSLNWWIAPTFSQSKMAMAQIKQLLPEGCYEEYKADLRIVIKTPSGDDHSVIEFKSGDNPDSLRGFGVNFFVCDEAARVLYDSFVSLVTTVTQTFGKGFFISTPKGRGWFYEIYQRGEKFDADGRPRFAPGEDPFPEWYAMRLPTWTNPHVKEESIIQMKRNLPEDVFRQEVAAQFLLDSAGVFRGVRDCIKGVLEPYVPGRQYVMGVDLARLKDFSVITVMDRERKHVVYYERFNQISWEVQYHKIIEIAKRYRAQTIIDSTGIGDPIVETIRNAGVRVEPYQISSAKAKQQLIDKLRVNIENQKISFPQIATLIRELEAYEYQMSDSGVVRFSAPSGMHDDSVISLALANWVADQPPFVYHYRNVVGI